MKKEIEHKCKNCLLADRIKGQCKVAILAEGQVHYMPIFPEDDCHMEKLGIEVQQVRWFVEDPKTGEPAEQGIVKMEYPEGFGETK